MIKAVYTFKISGYKNKRLKSKDDFRYKKKKVTNSRAPGARALMNSMILSAHSSAEEMVASTTVNDPGKCFPVLRKTIWLIQSLKKTNRKQKVIFQKEQRSKLDIALRNKILKERRREKYSYTRN